MFKTINRIIRNAPFPFNTISECCDNIDIEVGLGIDEGGFREFKGLSLRCNSCKAEVTVNRSEGYQGLVDKWDNSLDLI